ncbi:MAG: DUF1211 domain-containing protein [Candidatus Eremiobacteraeota bacterium]|nr:DUF1211 domain-containing protein [Candidatus Eremiobacteraeota bacterium]MBC5827486.1 DUF1211 domain-containing protein [Candidatus Eremiobacteraeota bacterium]
MSESPEFTLSKSRFEAFSDGVFAIAITLLVLEVHLPALHAPPISGAEQLRALLQIWPQYLVYFASFATIGIMWLNHHALFRYIERITHGIVLTNLLLLALISFLPFPTEVLARFGLTPMAMVYYGVTLSAIALGYFLVHRQVLAAQPSVDQSLKLWNIVGLTLYPVATIVGYFVPVVGIVLVGLLAVFYMMPQNIRGAVVRP